LINKNGLKIALKIKNCNHLINRLLFVATKSRIYLVGSYTELVDKGFVCLEVEYINGSKIESKANKYTFIWRKTVERNRAKLLNKIRVLLYFARYSFVH
jgi:hypothetical protein